MKKILVPLDGSERSLHSVELVKELYHPDDIELTLMYVKEDAQLFIDERSFADAEKRDARCCLPSCPKVRGI